MKAVAVAIKRRATYATVVATVTALAVMTGAGAFAASQLGKNSVGAKQLKKSSVTTAKIKKNAVSTAKIKKNAVTEAKIKEGSLTGANLQTSSSSFMRIVHEARGSGSTPLGASTVVPMDNATYTQAAGEDDFFFGTVEITFDSTCVGDRGAQAYVLRDAPNPGEVQIGTVAAGGSVMDESGGTVSKRLTIGPFQLGSGIFRPPAATDHTLSMVVQLNCESGSGASAANPAVDVIGVR